MLSSRSRPLAPYPTSPPAKNPGGSFARHQTLSDSRLGRHGVRPQCECASLDWGLQGPYRLRDRVPRVGVEYEEVEQNRSAVSPP